MVNALCFISAKAQGENGIVTKKFKLATNSDLQKFDVRSISLNALVSP